MHREWVKLLALFCLTVWVGAAGCSTPEVVFDQPRTAGPAAPASRDCVNLNSASAEELAALPGVGEVIALRIIEHRDTNGRFRRPQDVIIIEGFSERRYRAVADRICVE